MLRLPIYRTGKLKELKMNLGVSTSCFYPLETEISLEKIGRNENDRAERFSMDEFAALSALI